MITKISLLSTTLPAKGQSVLVLGKIVSRIGIDELLYSCQRGLKKEKFLSVNAISYYNSEQRFLLLQMIY